MAEAKAIEKSAEMEYVIPLRKEWNKVPRYKRTSKSVKAIKEFIARHMKVEDRDVRKVRLDSYLNNELWFRGSKKPPIKIKVKARKEGEIVRVEMAEAPEVVRFRKMKIEKMHKKAEKKETKAEEKKKEEKKGGESKAEETEEKKEEKEEKKKAEEMLHEKIAKQEAKQIKHTIGTKKEPQVFRKALKK